VRPSPSLADIKQSAEDRPGGRHDNDCEDFRDIQIVPTTGQMSSVKDPFLPGLLLPGEGVGSVPQLLDRTFRL
jgi:hypothetical protein